MSTPISGPVELKVKVATAATYVGGVLLLGILNATTTANLIAGLPDVVEAFVAPGVLSLITFVSGYLAKHTPRPDISAS